MSNQDVRRAYGQYYMHANETTVASEARGKLVPHAGLVIAFRSVHVGRQKYDDRLGVQRMGTDQVLLFENASNVVGSERQYDHGKLTVWRS